MAFWELRIPTSSETSEGLTNFLWEQGALGVVEEASPGEPPLLRAFYPESASPTRLLTGVGEYTAALAALGFPASTAEPQIGPLLDEAWATAWQASFPPRALGRRLRILPPWELGQPTGDDRIPVVIEPGRAFGTGHHGSTEGCLLLLDELVGPGPPRRVLDLGTGTGILAIAAIKLGAPRVVAIDVDPDALAAARRNAEANGCAERLEAALGGPESLPGDPPFDLVLANLLTHAHLHFSEHYARLVAPGGFLIAGGMLAEEDPRVRGALAAVGFAPRRRVVVDGWASLLLTRERA